MTEVSTKLFFHTSYKLRRQEAESGELIGGSARLDVDYGHLFDWTLVNDDLHVAATELRQLAQAVETEPLWVPASWLR